MKSVPYLCHHTSPSARTECATKVPGDPCCRGCILSQNVQHLAFIDAILPRIQRTWKLRWAHGLGPVPVN